VRLGRADELGDVPDSGQRGHERPVGAARHGAALCRFASWTTSGGSTPCSTKCGNGTLTRSFACRFSNGTLAAPESRWRGATGVRGSRLPRDSVRLPPPRRSVGIVQCALQR
jgi:hypothetical protein